MLRIWNGEVLMSQRDSNSYIKAYAEDIVGRKVSKEEAREIYTGGVSDVPVTLKEMSQLIRGELWSDDWCYCHAENVGFGITLDYNEI